MILDALVADATNIKEYNQHTSQVGDTLYDVGLKAGDTVVDVAGQVEILLMKQNYLKLTY